MSWFSIVPHKKRSVRSCRRLPGGHPPDGWQSARLPLKGSDSSASNGFSWRGPLFPCDLSVVVDMDDVRIVNVFAALPTGRVIDMALGELEPPITVNARACDVFVVHSD